jgi:hypothetical protein
MNWAAASCAMGSTVVEPDILIDPPKWLFRSAGVGPGCFCPQPETSVRNVIEASRMQACAFVP